MKVPTLHVTAADGIRAIAFLSAAWYPQPNVLILKTLELGLNLFTFLECADKLAYAAP